MAELGVCRNPDHLGTELGELGILRGEIGWLRGHTKVIRRVKNQNRPFAVSLEISQANLPELARAGLERFHFEFRHGFAHAHWQHIFVDCFV